MNDLLGMSSNETEGNGGLSGGTSLKNKTALSLDEGTDNDYNQALEKLNQTLRRAESTRGQFGTRVNTDHEFVQNHFGKNNESSAPPPKITYGGGDGRRLSGIQDVSVTTYNDDDNNSTGSFDRGDQLPSVEQHRFNVLTTGKAPSMKVFSQLGWKRSKKQQGNNTASTADSENRNLLQSNNIDAQNDFHSSLNVWKRRNQQRVYWMIAFLVFLGATIGIIVGCVVGFREGEAYELLKEEANGEIEIPPFHEGDDENPFPLTSKTPNPTTLGVDDSTKPPPRDPLLRTVEVQKWLLDNQHVQKDQLADVLSHQYKAAYWISNLDTAQLDIPNNAVGEADHVVFLERYIMMAFYYATNGSEKSWVDPYQFGTPSSVCEWNKINDQGHYTLNGVECNEDNSIVAINMPSNHVSGSIISELGLLSNLKYLALNHNQLGGQLPDALGELTSLTYLALQYNALTGDLAPWIGVYSDLRLLGLSNNNFGGTIPYQWNSLESLETLGLDDNKIGGNLTTLESVADNLQQLYLGNNDFTQVLHQVQWDKFFKLQELDLSSNHIKGTIPTSLVKLSGLEVLILSDNSISGKLPEIRQQSSDDPTLKYLALQKNVITGTIHPSIGELDALIHLDLANNSLMGSIPHQMGSMTNLKYLFLSQNPQFEAGGIPQFLLKLTDLEDLSLMKSNRVGEIPSNVISKLTNLVLLDLEDNDLTGNIPTTISQLTNLKFLMLNRNQDLSGIVPEGVQQLPRLDIFMIDRTSLEGDLNTLCSGTQRKPEVVGADCQEDPDIDTPLMSCSCCNVCCSSYNANEDAAQGLTNTTSECRDKVYIGQLDPEWEESYQRKEYQFDGRTFSKGDIINSTTTSP